MNADASQAISTELSKDERLLWSGRPRQGLVFRSADLLLIPCSLLWGGFAFFWEYSVLSYGKQAAFFALFGIPFVLIGLYIIAGRFFADSYQRGRTFYGLTTERVLIVSGLFNRRVESLSLRNLPELTLSEGSNGEGSIVFGTKLFNQFFRGVMWPGISRQKAPTFDMIENVRQVYNQVREAQRHAV